MIKGVLAASPRKSLLLLAILLLSATELFAQSNSGLGSSEPGEIGLSSWNNDAGLLNSGAAPIAPGLTVDWVSRGAVTRVKDQGTSCDSSWAFSATGALEGWGKIEKGHLPSLSEQELIDCAGSLGAQACDGGDPEAGLVYAMEKGLCHESAYPYRGKPGKCKPCLSPHDRPMRIYRIPKNSEELLKAQVDRQPVAVVIDGSVLSSYKSGIIAGACGKQLDTSALVVGYGQDGPISYWLLKNSRGPDWGEEGYFRLVRNKNECGIAEFAVFPALEH